MVQSSLSIPISRMKDGSRARLRTKREKLPQDHSSSMSSVSSRTFFSRYFHSLCIINHQLDDDSPFFYDHPVLCYFLFRPLSNVSMVILMMVQKFLSLNIFFLILSRKTSNKSIHIWRRSSGRDANDRGMFYPVGRVTDQHNLVQGWSIDTIGTSRSGNGPVGRFYGQFENFEH